MLIISHIDLLGISIILSVQLVLICDENAPFVVMMGADAGIEEGEGCGRSISDSQQMPIVQSKDAMTPAKQIEDVLVV